MQKKNQFKYTQKTKLVWYMFWTIIPFKGQFRLQIRHTPVEVWFEGFTGRFRFLKTVKLRIDASVRLDKWSERRKAAFCRSNIRFCSKRHWLRGSMRCCISVPLFCGGFGHQRVHAVGEVDLLPVLREPAIKAFKKAAHTQKSTSGSSASDNSNPTSAP